VGIDYAVVIPTNRPARDVVPTLRDCAQALADGRGELVVVDNAPQRPVVDAQLLEQHVAAIPNARLIKDAIPGLLTGRMRGVLESSADVIVYLDDDVALDAQWPQAVAENFADRSVCLVGGPSAPDWGDAVPAWLHGFIRQRGERVAECSWLSLLDLGDERMLINPNYVWGLNFAIRRSVLDECGGFHPDCMPDDLQHFQGDGETGLTMKIAATGRKAVYDPRMKVWHRVGAKRMTPEYFYRRAFYQGVCDSFMQLRKSPAGDGVSATAETARRRLRRFRDSVREIVDSLAALPRGRGQGPGYRTVKRGTDWAYTAGQEFHRAAFTSCAAVRQWVLKPEYRDYTLPRSGFDATRVRRECLRRHGVPVIW